MYGSGVPFSYSPRGFSQEDLPPLRRPFQQEEPRTPRATLLQSNNMSRPSGKSIYMQRKEYSETLNKQTDEFHVRVEHLFTCEMDGQEVKRLDDCLAKLKRLDTKGRLWPQEMIMEAQGGILLLSDVESKTELESLPLSSIRQTKAILDSCAYDSLLAITVQHHKRHPQCFMFQCEETGAEIIKGDLDKAVQRRASDVEPRRDQSDIRSNLENILGQHAPGGFQQAGPRPVLRESPQPPPDHPPARWADREPERMPPPRDYAPREEMLHPPGLREPRGSPEVPPEQSDSKRNTDILNHILSDLEVFMDKVSAAVNAPSAQTDKGKKKNPLKKKKSKKTAAPADGLPSREEYISCLQKIKYGFNLLGQLDGSLTSPSAPDFVHIFFTCLSMIVPRYPADLPPTVLSPLLTEETARLLGQVVGPEEGGLWRSLGDPWNIPSSRWPDDIIPPYIPEFYDGWRAPAPSRVPSPLPYHDGPVGSSSSQRRPPDQPSRQIDESRSYSPRAVQRRPEEPVGNSAWNPPPPPTNSREPPLYMRVIYDFVARNHQELSIMKGDVVQVIQKTKQWWLVCNAREEEGSVPQNVLEPMSGGRPREEMARETRGPVTLDMSSSPAEVKAWLQYRGFSKITVSSLGVLTGKLLLGMSKDDIRTVCPEEGGKVFFQLQAVKSAIALASEPSGQYNGRY